MLELCPLFRRGRDGSSDACKWAISSKIKEMHALCSVSWQLVVLMLRFGGRITKVQAPLTRNADRKPLADAVRAAVALLLGWITGAASAYGSGYRSGWITKTIPQDSPEKPPGLAGRSPRQRAKIKRAPSVAGLVPLANFCPPIDAANLVEVRELLPK